MEKSELQKRKSIIDHCLQMNANGLNQGTSGNISLRHATGMLITPTSLPYDRMQPEDIVFVGMDGQATGSRKPSSEWRFHRDILAARPDVGAVVHTHATYATILAIMGKSIPPLHYMIAAAGGPDIRVAPYAIYGSQELSDHVVAALQDRRACLMDHHGMLATGPTLERAMWLAVEVETLARQYHGCLALGSEPPLLSPEQIEAVRQKFEGGYGISDAT
ncbi:MAG: class II aldolase/adducin family protein [Pseudomonadota bacterium]